MARHLFPLTWVSLFLVVGCADVTFDDPALQDDDGDDPVGEVSDTLGDNDDNDGDDGDDTGEGDVEDTGTGTGAPEVDTSPKGPETCFEDVSTGLCWIGSPDSQPVNREEADTYCSTVKAAGYDDWRLPTVDELKSFVSSDCSSIVNSCAMGDDCTEWTTCRTGCESCNVGDPETCHWKSKLGEHCSSAHWSSVVGIGFSGSEGYITVLFDNGWVSVSNSSAHISCVRSDAPVDTDTTPEPTDTETIPTVDTDSSSIIGPDSCYDDVTSGLCWIGSPDSKPIRFDEASEYCENVVAAGRDDWRLPSISELKSLVSADCYSVVQACSMDEDCFTWSECRDGCESCSAGLPEDCHWKSPLAEHCSSSHWSMTEGTNWGGSLGKITLLFDNGWTSVSTSTAHVSCVSEAP